MCGTANFHTKFYTMVDPYLPHIRECTVLEKNDLVMIMVRRAKFLLEEMVLKRQQMRTTGWQGGAAQ